MRESPVVVLRDDVPAAHEPSSRGLRTDWLGWVACVVTLAGFALVLVGWASGGGALSVPWAPTLDLRLSFVLDGLGALYALLATEVGALVFAYGTRYLTVHLEHEGRLAREGWRFWPWMALFAAAMVGLATARWSTCSRSTSDGSGGRTLPRRVPSAPCRCVCSPRPWRCSCSCT
jgi:multicomponent Na+:H+ antiporter subunit A